MPARIVPIDGNDHWQDIQAIHAVMAYPEDDTLASERFWAPVWMDRVLNLPDDGELAVGKTDLLAMLRAPSVNDVLEFSQKRSKSGQIAGHILMLCVGMEGEGLPVSIRKAGYLLEKFYIRLQQAGGEAVRASIRTINNAWQSHATVAHIWAANSTIRMESAGNFESLSPESLPKLIAWSEWFREKGETLIPTRQRHAAPLLDSGETWRFPDELVQPLPDDSILRLPEWALDALHEYRSKS